MIFPFKDSRMKISAFNLDCEEFLFSIAACDDAMVSSKHQNVIAKLKASLVRCKSEKCCAYESLTVVIFFRSESNFQYRVQWLALKKEIQYLFYCDHRSFLSRLGWKYMCTRKNLSSRRTDEVYPHSWARNYHFGLFSRFENVDTNYIKFYSSCFFSKKFPFIKITQI